jgi:lysophospholipase L1-like esterase
MRRTLVIVGAAFGLSVFALFGFLLYVLLASGDPRYWEGEIAAFERRDVSNPPPHDAVLFIGADDVRFWSSLPLDMAPVPVIARGFGGAQIAHVTHYIPRIVVPYRPRAIVLMAGEADLSDVRGRRPEDVLDDFKEFVAALRAQGVKAPVYFVSLHPSPMRVSRWFGAARANTLIQEYEKTADDLFFINIAEGMLDRRGNVRDDLFRWDGLSLNASGYALLTEKIKPVLLAAGYGSASAER